MAQLQVGIKADVRGARQVTRALRDIKAAAGQTAGSLQATSAAASKTSVSLSTTASASGALATSQNLAAVANASVARTLGTVATQATRSSGSITATTQSTNILTSAFTRLGTTASATFARITAGAAGMGKQMATAAGAVTGLSTAAVGIGAAAVIGVGVGVKSAKDFEKTFSEIKGLVGLTNEEIADLKGPLEDIGRATAKGPNELAEALFFITSAGARGQDALDILEQSAKAAAAGLGETKIVADAVTSAVNAYGAENINAAQATDVLVATVREGKAEADSIAGSLGKILPVASATGVGFDELGASIAALTRIGLGADEAGTALRATLSTIQKPSKQARDTLEEFGTSATELRRKIADEGVLAGLQDLRDRFGDNEEALTKVFPNIRAVTGVLGLVGENADEVQKIFAELADATGATDDAFEAYAETAGKDLDDAITDIQFALKDIGQELLPVVAAVAKAAAGAFTLLADAVEAVGDAFRLTGELAETAGKAIAEAVSGSDDPIIRNINNIRELQDELDRLQSGGRLRSFFTEVGGIDLEGSREKQIAQIEEALRLQRQIELQNGREELARQRIAAGLRQEADIIEEIVVTAKERSKLVDPDELARGVKSVADLRSEVEFLEADLTNLQELGQDGIGLAEDFFTTRDIVRALQGETSLTAATIRGLINDKRRLGEEIDKINEAFAAQDAATDFLDDLAMDTALLADKFQALSDGSSMLNIDTLQQAQQIFDDLGDQAGGRTVQSIQQEIIAQNALNAAIEQMPVDKYADLQTQIATLQALNFDPESSYFGQLDDEIKSLGDAAVDAVLKAEGLKGLDQIMFEALPKEEQMEAFHERLKNAFNLAGIVDPEQNPEFVAALEAFEAKLDGTGDAMDEFAKNAARNLQSAFADFLFDPFEEGLDGMLRGFVDTLRRMAAEALAAAAIKAMIDALSNFGGGGNTGGFAGFLNAAGAAFGGGMADGGPVQPNKTFMVGERGPELFTPNQSGNIVSNEMMRGGGTAPAPTVNVAPAPVVVVDDPSKVEKALQTANGQRALVEAVTEKRGAIKQALGP